MIKRYQPLHYKAPEKRAHRKLLRLIWVPLVLIVCGWLLYTQFGVALVSGSSMMPQLKNGDLIFFQKNAVISYGDVIVLKRDEKYMVKRVAALPGDAVEITETGLILVNGTPKPIMDILLLGVTTQGDIRYPVQLSGEEYFVLGDNRSISKDSRSSEIGAVLASEICGRVVWSIQRQSGG